MPSPRKCNRLALKRQRPPSPEPPALPPKVAKKRMTNAERMKQFREKRKQDPEKYQQYLQQNKDQCRAYRRDAPAERKAQESENGKERVRKSRQKKKELKKAEPPRVTMRADIITAQEAQRAKWREEKQKQSANMHWETKQAKNERRRALYHERQAEKKRAKRS